jgi:hypothetical protein
VATAVLVVVCGGDVLARIGELSGRTMSVPVLKVITLVEKDEDAGSSVDEERERVCGFLKDWKEVSTCPSPARSWHAEAWASAAQDRDARFTAKALWARQLKNGRVLPYTPPNLNARSRCWNVMAMMVMPMAMVLMIFGMC